MSAHRRALCTTLKLSLALLLLACQGRSSPLVDAGADDEAPARVDVLWVGAHPDDEVLVAPILGADCVDGELSCGLLVLTRGEAGNCKRPALCAGTDLGTVRASELRASAKLFRAGLETWDLGDGTGGDAQAVIDAWSARSGGTEALRARMVDALRRWSPAVVYTFDPRHGSTCHPDHRATAALLLAAAAELGEAAPEVRMVESIIHISLAPAQIGFRPAADDPAVVRVDATAFLASIGGEAWGYAVRVLQAHPTQFTDDEVAALGAAPAGQRAVYWLNQSSAMENDPRYQSLCAP
jgi:LmbE family N-acetylglucosaminyl deacetylase